MSDIVERLRDLTRHALTDRTEAADEVERLRALSAEMARALERMLTVFDTPPGFGLPGAEQETCASARAALSKHRDHVEDGG